MSPWFPVFLDGPDGWRLDAVSLFAVIGEATMRNHCQSITASWLCLLPRLLPAPQALLSANRPSRLPATPAFIVGSRSGVFVNDLNFYGNAIHELDTLKQFEFRRYSIKHKSKDGTHRLHRVSPRWYSLLNLLSLTSCIATMALFGWTVQIHDGSGALAIGTLALQSSIVGLASWWNPQLSTRPTKREAPPGNIVIRTREGAFVVVLCNEEIARELYIGTESANYKLGDRTSKFSTGIATLLLMAGVVFIANSTWWVQAAIGIAYGSLNALYWLASLLPTRFVWDLDRHYDWKIEQTVDGQSPTLQQTKIKKASSKASDCSDGETDVDPVIPSFTRTLWYAIQATGSTDWAVTSRAVPDTPYWKEWLRLAEMNKDNAKWKAFGEMQRLMRMANDNEALDAAQHARTTHEHQSSAPANRAPPLVPAGNEIV